MITQIMKNTLYEMKLGQSKKWYLVFVDDICEDILTARQHLYKSAWTASNRLNISHIKEIRKPILH